MKSSLRTIEEALEAAQFIDHTASTEKLCRLIKMADGGILASKLYAVDQLHIVRQMIKAGVPFEDILRVLYRKAITGTPKGAVHSWYYVVKILEDDYAGLGERIAALRAAKS